MLRPIFTPLCAGLGLVVLVLTLGGCATNKATPERSPSVRAEDWPDPSVLASLRQGAWVYERTRGHESPHKVICRIHPTSQGWLIHLEGVRTLHLGWDEDGSLLILEEQEFYQGVSITYDPPLVFLPKSFPQGQPWQGETAITVSNLDDGSLRDRGWCRYTIEAQYCAPGELAHQAKGQVQIHSVRQITLSLAKVRVEITSIFQEGLGEVAQQITQNIRPLGLFSIRQTEELRLMGKVAEDQVKQQAGR